MDAPSPSSLSQLQNPANDHYVASVYRADGSMAYSVDAEGYVTVYDYSVFSDVTRTIRHAAQIPNWSPATTLPAKASDLPIASSHTLDQVSATAFDETGRARFSIDASGAVVEMRYNGFGEVVGVLAYDAVMSPWNGSVACDIKAMTDWATGHASDADNRYEASVYGADGTKRYDVDARGYLTAYATNSFGELSSVTKHSNGVGSWSATSILPADGSLPVAADSAKDRTTVTISDALGREPNSRVSKAIRTKRAA